MLFVASRTLQQEARGNPITLPAPRKPLFRSLDLWRGLICLLIVARHTAYLKVDNLTTLNWHDDPLGVLSMSPVLMGWIRVPLFFVISGYCLSALADKLRRSETPVVTFILRRVRRIFIPYWIYMVLMVPVALAIHSLGEGWWSRWPDIIDDPRKLSWIAWLGNMTLIEHWRHFFSRGPLEALYGGPIQTQPIWGHLWSLSYEVMIYILCAMILMISRRRVLIGMLAMGPIAAIPLLFMDHPLLPIEWLEFSIGVLLYCQANYFSRREAWAASAFLVLVMGLAVLAESTQFLLAGYARMIAVSAGFALVLGGLRRWDDVLSRARFLQPRHRCGRISYSIYLVHMPISMAISESVPVNDTVGVWPLLLIGMPLSVALSILAGAGFYRIAEAPVLVKKPAMSAG